MIQSWQMPCIEKKASGIRTVSVEPDFEVPVDLSDGPQCYSCQSLYH